MTEAEARQWIKEVGIVVAKATTISTTEVDDKIVRMFFEAIDSDFIWGFLWPVIDGLFEDSNKVMATADFDDACTAKAINPLTVLAIVRAILELWKQFRPS